MAEYGEELVREYLEIENDAGQWFVLINHKVKASTKYEPKCIVSHTIRHLSKVEMLK